MTVSVTLIDTSHTSKYGIRIGTFAKMASKGAFEVQAIPAPGIMEANRRADIRAELLFSRILFRYLPTMTSPGKEQTLAAQGRALGTADSWHGKITAEGPFTPEVGRYRLYIGLFCPYAHRANLIRHLKGLKDIIPLTTVKPYPKGNDKGYPGWQFPATADEYPGSDLDPLFGAKYLHELYFKDDPDYKGVYSVPLLWDTKTNAAVNNESLELLRDLQTSFNSLLPEGSAERELTVYPDDLRPQIDEVSAWLLPHLCNGVYRAGFNSTQEGYDASVPFILGSRLTELDITAYATVVRFDTIYVQHFKCNLGTVRHDYPQVNNWLKNLYWNVPGFRETTDFRHIKENYTKSHASINPLAITPMGPWPEVEEGYESDLSKVRVGGVKMPKVLELEEALVGKL
ncbi:glutathione S-transferase Gst3 [Pyricularia oryzae]|nr:glutathione S-transferase Gst3 [Pyricularia oryzae]